MIDLNTNSKIIKVLTRRKYITGTLGIGTDSYTEHKGTKSLLGATRVLSFWAVVTQMWAEVKTELKAKIYAPGDSHIKPRFKGKSFFKKRLCLHYPQESNLYPDLWSWDVYSRLWWVTIHEDPAGSQTSVFGGGVETGRWPQAERGSNPSFTSCKPSNSPLKPQFSIWTGGWCWWLLLRGGD